MSAGLPGVRLRAALAGVLLLLAGACAAPPEPADRRPATAEEIVALGAGIAALGPGVSPAEARRAAEVALTTSRELARAYHVTDPPLVHNTKVNLGLRTRGLCYHWADDLEARLRAEGFQTLALHRAIANSDARFRIEHSTVILSQRGATMAEGMVLDPWRGGGDLFWAPVPQDSAYTWVPRAEVFASREARDR